MTSENTPVQTTAGEAVIIRPATIEDAPGIASVHIRVGLPRAQTSCPLRSLGPVYALLRSTFERSS